MKYRIVLYRLNRWGGWAKDSGQMGLPTQSSFMRVSRGTGFTSPHIPADIEEVDLAVRKTPVEERQVVIVEYTTGGNREDKALRLKISRRTYSRVLERGISYVEQFLDDCPVIHISSPILRTRAEAR